jgi:hypothetical protein
VYLALAVCLTFKTNSYIFKYSSPKYATLKKRFQLFIAVICMSLVATTNVIAQEENTEEAPADTVGHLALTGYIDAYYAHYSDSVQPGYFQQFPTASPRSDNIGLNIAMIDCKYQGKKVRAHIALHYGDIASSTWSLSYNSIARAHAGIRLAKGLWLDAGFFRTHFGTELLYPIENIANSVTVGTYFEPYYEAGARLEYTPNSKFSIDLYALNGYGIFQDNNKQKSVGILAAYAFSDNFNLNYSNYIGDDSAPADSVTHLRIAQNLYANLTFGKLFIQAGGDLYIQQHSNITNGDAGFMYSALLTAKYQFIKKFALYARGEIFNDENGFVSALIANKRGTFEGDKLWGVTAGAEFRPFENAYVRIEGRLLQMEDGEEIFKDEDGTPTGTRLEAMVTMGVSFDIIKKVFIKK